MSSKNVRLVAVIVGVAAMLLIAASILGLVAYSNSKRARLGVLTDYFEAFAIGDRSRIGELVTEDFSSDLPVQTLDRGGYSLFDFGSGETPDGRVQRFVLVSEGNNGLSTAWLADMTLVRSGLYWKIASIRVSESGIQVR